MENVMENVTEVNNDTKASVNKKSGYSVRVCKRCGNMFIISDDAIIKSVKEYGVIPKRCTHCRKEAQKRFDNKETE